MKAACDFTGQWNDMVNLMRHLSLSINFSAYLIDEVDFLLLFISQPCWNSVLLPRAPSGGLLCIRRKIHQPMRLRPLAVSFCIGLSPGPRSLPPLIWSRDSISQHGSRSNFLEGIWVLLAPSHFRLSSCLRIRMTPSPSFGSAAFFAPYIVTVAISTIYRELSNRLFQFALFARFARFQFLPPRSASRTRLD